MATAPGTIENISDTARWVAFYRAVESERPDALFHDPYARQLAGPQGEAIARTIPGGRSSGWAMVVRTALIDEILLRLVEREGVDSVLNLAAGLDARPWRLSLPATLRWTDADLPEILAYKQRALENEPTHCDYRAVPIDLRDAERRQALFADVAAGGQQTLILSEGLLVYLEPEHVRSLAADLRRPASFRWWMFDLSSPRLLRMLSRRWGSHLAAGNAPFKFGPEEGTDFFSPLGWVEAEYRGMWEESARLKRTMPLYWLWNLLARLNPSGRAQFRGMSGVALLARA
jgi:methyltransferase (TIGR00027 family)